MLSGATGFIGASFSKKLRSRGHTLISLQRGKEKCGIFDTSVAWQLGDVVPDHYFEDVDLLIHMAHDFTGAVGAEQTLQGTVSLFEQGRRLNVKRQILISSYSAGIHADSHYGRTKFKLEKYFLSRLQSVVRPGLVLGDGGIFWRLKSVAQGWKFVPLPDGGIGGIPVISIDLLVSLMSKISEDESRNGEFNLFNPDLCSLRDLVLRVAEKVGNKVVIIPVPSIVILYGLMVCELLRLKLPVSSDNLKGFLSNQEARHTSSLSKNLELIK